MQSLRFKLERLGWLLAPFSFLFFLWSVLRNVLYDQKLLSTYRLPIPVISVGSPAAGGTGKTPVVIALALLFQEKKVAILTRGYRGGDEAELMRRRCPNAMVIVDPDRVRGGKKAVELGADLILLDDGFQHRRLERDFDLLLLDDRAKRYLPWGTYRESPNKRKGDAIWKNVEKRFEGIWPRWPTSPLALFCGIGRPESFEATVRSLGIEVVDRWFLADHEAPRKEDLRRFQKKVGVGLICTEKDAMKLPQHLDFEVFVVQIGVVIPPEIVAKIGRMLDNRRA
jgi:tetraacyldisaccharide 4'-kinase